MEVIYVEATNGKLNGTKGIVLVCIPNGIKSVPEEKYWVPPLKDGMEVERNIAMLGATKGM